MLLFASLTCQTRLSFSLTKYSSFSFTLSRLPLDSFFGEPRRERIIRETGKAPKDFLMLVIKKKEEVKTTETANNDVVLIKDITHKQEKDDRKR